MKKILPIVCFAVLGVWVAAQAQRNITLDGNNLFPPIPPAAGTSGALIEFEATLNAMDAVGGDVVDVLLLDITNADHAGGTLNGVHIDTIVGDAQANEYATYFGDGWDYHLYSGWPLYFGNGYDQIYFQSSTANTLRWDGNLNAAASQDFLQLNIGTMGAADGGDTYRMFVIDPTNANHAGANNYVYGMFIDDIAEDDQAYEAAIVIESPSTSWDAALMIQERNAIAAENPPTGFVSCFVDDSADYSGAGGNDCAFVCRDAGGNEGSIIVRLNGACN